MTAARTFLPALLLTLCALLSPLAAQARCAGVDLIAALPPADRAALQVAADSHPHARGNLWRATRGDQVIHLVGTYHLGDARHERLMRRLEPLVDSADLLLVEAGPEEETRLKAELVQRPDFMFLIDGPTLPELLGEADWTRLATEMKARGIPPFVASKFRPWYMAMMLGVPPCALDGVTQGERGLDHQLIARAQARDLPVKALEPFDTLFSIFGDLTMAQELEMIRGALLMADRPEDMTVTLANAYFAGQPRLVWEFTLLTARRAAGADPGGIAAQFELMDQVLMSRRNEAWIPILLAAAAQGQVLAASGALHLSGDRGILALLEAEGFTVTRLDTQ